MEVIGPIVDIFKSLVTYLSQQLTYLKGLSENLKTLKSELEVLSSREKEVKMEIEKSQMQTGKKPKNEVVLWQEKVQNVRNEVHKIEENSREDLRCCKGCFPNCFSRLELSKIAEKKIKEIAELQEKSRFADGLFTGLSSENWMTLPTSTLAGKTAEKTKELIWVCLRDADVSVIGVYGIGGVGKTATMKHIYNQLNQASVFHSVIWVTVSKASTLEQLQNNVAKSLDCEVPMDADEIRMSQVLHAALERRKKFVLILDDMWTAFPLEKVGLPKPDRENGCKVVFTTRSLEVCRGMESQTEIKVEVLTEEEAWELFKDKVGLDFSPEVEAIAKLVAKECCGLPLAIITVGRSMREKRDIRLWRNTLSELRSSKTEIQSMEDDVFVSLKFSYDRLRNNTIQACFLYCALYPEDFAIPTKDLMEHWIGEELIDEVGDREDQMDKGQAILDELKSACMLESVSNVIHGECIKMHDLIRDMAIVTTRVQPRFMVKAGVGLKAAPKEDEWFEDVERISLMRNNIEMLSGRPNCPNLSTLLLQGNHRLTVIHDSYFEHMRSLKVLDLSSTKIESLPASLSNLENLRTLLLHHCAELKKLPSLAKLKALRVLDLYYAPIEELPQGMEALVNLRHVDLSWTYELQFFPAGILPKLPNLEDMIMYGSQWRWSSNTREIGGRATIKEVNSLTHLANLSIHIADLQSFLSYVSSRKWQALKSFHLMVGLPSQSKLLPSDYTVEIHGCDLVSQDPSLVLPNNTRVLGIYECNLSRLSELFCLSNVRELRECSIYRCDGMECILIEDEDTLPSLETLEMKFLPKVHALYKGVVSHGTLGSLKNLDIGSCDSLKNLLSLELLQNLQNLEQIRVRYCDLIEEIIEMDEKNDDSTSTITLPRLKKLSLRGLRELKSICRRVIICSSLQSIRVRECPKLKKLPFSTGNIQPSLEEIKGEKEWWDALQWDDSNAKALLQPHFVELVQ